MTTKKPKGPPNGERKASPSRGTTAAPEDAAKRQPPATKPSAPPAPAATDTEQSPVPSAIPPEPAAASASETRPEAPPAVAPAPAAAVFPGETMPLPEAVAPAAAAPLAAEAVVQPALPQAEAASAAPPEPAVAAVSEPLGAVPDALESEADSTLPAADDLPEEETLPQREGSVPPAVPPLASEAAVADAAVDDTAAGPSHPAEPWAPEPAEAAPAAVPEPEPEYTVETASVATYSPEPVAAPEPPPQPYRPSMFIVHVSPEIAPVAKVGGLADVVFGLAKEQEIRGNHVEIVLPKYDSLRYDQIWGLTETYNDLWVPWYGGSIHCTVYFGFAHGRKCFFIEPHSADNFFNRGCIYGFNDDILRFAFFSRAALEFLWKSGKHPDIIHCHDWQTALIPVFLYEIYQHLGMTHPRVCFTIHNFKHQGVTGANLLHATGLNRPEYYFHYDRLRDNHNVHALNLTKGGIVYANFVTTVSPRHATEAKDHGEGFGLEPTLHIHHQKYGGVLNGIDYEAWNPEIDRYIPFHYSVDHIDDKYKNKIALRDRLLLSDNEKPIVAFIGRLDPQKGLELIRHALFYTLHRNGQFILLGSSPDSQINNYFWGLKHQLNENPDCHIEIGFNEELSHLIYAGADIVIVPSRFEPCGLTQMIAMRYGTIPVVREVGGLADTVFDKDHSHRPLHERNGYIFRDYDFGGLESALGRAISCYYEYPEHFRELIGNAMRYDYSWNHPGQDYMNIYDYIREK